MHKCMYICMYAYVYNIHKKYTYYICKGGWEKK